MRDNLEKTLRAGHPPSRLSRCQTFSPPHRLSPAVDSYSSRDAPTTTASSTDRASQTHDIKRLDALELLGVAEVLRAEYLLDIPFTGINECRVDTEQRIDKHPVIGFRPFAPTDATDTPLFFTTLTWFPSDLRVSVRYRRTDRSERPIAAAIAAVVCSPALEHIENLSNNLGFRLFDRRC